MLQDDERSLIHRIESEAKELAVRRLHEEVRKSKVEVNTLVDLLLSTVFYHLVLLGVDINCADDGVQIY